MSIKKRSLIILLLIFFVFGSGIIFNIIRNQNASNTTPSIIFLENKVPTYEKVLNNNLPDYKTENLNRNEFITHIDHQYAPLIFLNEIQANAMFSAEKIDSWYPHFLSTGVIAIDRDQNHDEIKGWIDLLLGDYKIYVDRDRDFLFYIAQGLDGKFIDATNTEDYYQNLFQHNRLIMGTHVDQNIFNQAEVAIITDNEAVQLKKLGKNIEIIIPEEGTISYSSGLALQKNGNNEAIKNELKIKERTIQEELLVSGYRLLDHRADLNYFPDAEKYLVSSDIKNKTDIQNSNIKQLTDYLKNVKSERRYSSSYIMEHLIIYLIAIFVIVFWGSTIMFRISDEKIRVEMSLLLSMFLLWICFKSFKLIALTDSAARIFWYCYYIPLSLIPVFWFIISYKISKEKNPPKSFIILFIVSGLFIVLTLTNDVHQMVFKFNDNMVNWAFEYRYSILYHIFVAYVGTLLVAGTVLIMHKQWNEPSKKGIRWPFAVLIFIMIYHLLHTFRVPIIFNSEITIVMVFGYMLFIEAILQNNLIATNMKYKLFFQNTPQEMYWLSQEKKAMIKTKTAKLTDEELQALFQQQTREKYEKNGQIYKIDHVRGGYIIWKEDISQILTLKKELSEIYEKLTKRHDVLQREKYTTKILGDIKMKKRILEAVELGIADKIDNIHQLTRDMVSYQDIISEKYFLEKISNIKMMISYCKRMSNLIVLSEKNKYIHLAELEQALQETLIDSQVIGIESGIMLCSNEEILANDVILIYNFIYSIIECAMNFKKSSLFISIHVVEKELRVKIMFDADNEEIQVHSLPIKEAILFELEKNQFQYYSEVEFNSLIIELKKMMGSEIDVGTI